MLLNKDNDKIIDRLLKKMAKYRHHITRYERYLAKCNKIILGIITKHEK